MFPCHQWVLAWQEAPATSSSSRLPKASWTFLRVLPTNVHERYDYGSMNLSFPWIPLVCAQSLTLRVGFQHAKSGEHETDIEDIMLHASHRKILISVMRETNKSKNV